MRPGVVGLLPGDPGQITPEHARRIRACGFTGASVMIADPDSCPPASLVRARDVLAAEGVRVAQANARYPSLVHPDEARRAEGVRLAQRACAAARRLDAVFLLIRPGSLHPGGDWRPHPANHAAATCERLIDSLRQVCRAAEDEGVLIGLECHVVSPLDTPRRIRQVIEAVGSASLRYNADPVNLVGSLQDAYDTTGLLHRAFDELGRYVISAHVKDLCLGERLVLHLDECAPGEGIFDLQTFLRLYEQYHPDGYALIEHLPDDKIPEAKRALDAALAGAGLSWRT
jgi:sugar phosphate isomerase/epimerase